ncbi:MAG: DNA-3-methyladenine glycosylase [Geodermatophilaceae bacterium]
MDLAEQLSGRALTAAPHLLGAVLSHTSAQGTVAVRITEVEAYSGDGSDPAAHTHRGRTPRNEVMFGPAGTLYVYFSYGMHWCANVVCARPGDGEAVLLRAGGIVEGLELARRRRATARRDVDLARGPARLTQALGITGAANGAFLLDPRSPVSLAVDPSIPPSSQVDSGPRIGITKATALPWRFWLVGEPSVSRGR